MELVRHYRALAEGCRKHAQEAKSESVRKRYETLAERYLALAAEREKFLQAIHEETLSAALGRPNDPVTQRDELENSAPHL